MPEAVVIISEELERKSDKAPHKAKDGNGEVWVRWDQDWKPLLGKRVKLLYEDKSREFNGRTFTDHVVSEAHEAPEAPETPPLGTGEYVTGQKPAIEVRRIFASTAWNCAARMAQADLGFDAAQNIANKIFYDLLKKGHAIEDEDIPF